MSKRLHRLPHWQIGPAILVALAAAVAVATGFHSPTTLNFGPMRLSPGASRSVQFEVGYDETYAVGLQMDQQIAKRLAPCLADFDGSPRSSREACERAAQSGLPPAFRIRLVGDGKDLSSTVRPSIAIGGGQYEGSETYTWEAAYVRLRPGIKYDLTLRSSRDATILSPANPQLVVKVSTPGFYDGLAIQGFGAFLLAAVLLAVGTVWTFVGRNMSRRHDRAKTRAASTI